MQRYLIVIEPTDSGFSAYSPDVPGCVATARTQSDVERAMQDAIRFHLAGLREDGQPIPQANTSAAYVEVAA